MQSDNSTTIVSDIVTPELPASDTAIAAVLPVTVPADAPVNAAPVNAAPVKPASKRAGKRSKPASDKPASTAKPTDTANDRRIARLDSVISAGATNYGETSSRDDAFLAFYTLCASGPDKRTIALASLISHAIQRRNNASGKPKPCNPFYAGSGLATDGGAANRAIAAGHLVRVDASTLRLTIAGAERGRGILNRLRRAKPSDKPVNVTGSASS